MVAILRLCALLTPAESRRSSDDGRPISVTGGVLDTANAALVTPRLWDVLVKGGAAGSVPADLSAFMQRFHALNRTRNALLARQLAEAARSINAAGVRPMVLKGGIALLADDANLRARRVITDLDLQIPEASAGVVEGALADLGYGRLRSYRANPHAHAIADLERAGDLATIDLHRYLLSFSGHRSGRTHLAGLLPPEQVRARAAVVRTGGAEMLLPSPRDQILHLILQDQVQDRDHFAGRIKLRRLLDLSDLLRENPDVDTEALVAQVRPYGLATAARSHLYAAHALFRAPVGEGIRTSLAARVHHRRRTWAAEHPRAVVVNVLLGAIAYEFARCRFPPGADARTLLRWRLARLADVLNRRRFGVAHRLQDVASRL